MPDPVALRGVTLHDPVAASLRTLVFDGALGPGDWVDEKALAEAWHVSRTPLREAIKVLAAEGLVELVPRRGARVIELTDADGDALFPIMALLEGRCAFEAVTKASDEDLRALRTHHAELEHHAARHDIDGYYRANHVFHSFVQRLADNRWLDRITGDLRRFMRLMRGRQLALPGRVEASLEEHRALIEAFVERDAVRAERLMHDHLLAQLAALRKLRRRAASAARAKPARVPHVR